MTFMQSRDYVTILALDLSLTSTGYAVLTVNNGEIKLVANGHIKNPASKVVKKETVKFSMGVRLNKIANEIQDLLYMHDVDYVVREASFSNSRIKATQSIFMVNGAVASRLAMHGYEDLVEIAPSGVKKAVAGHGKASKGEVMEALKYYVGEHEYATDDESDAVAVGIAYALQENYIK